jgi:hypothetical protein
MSRPNSILDLTSICVALCEISNLVLADVRSNLVQECRPDLFLGRFSELIEVKGYVDSRKESFVESLDTVSGQENNALVVF